MSNAESINAPVRLMDELGRIVLPMEARKVMDWGEKTPIEIWVDSTNQQLVLKKHTSTCCLCGASEGLKSLNKRHFCGECRRAVSKL